MATVVYKGISKNFGKVQALQDINIEVKTVPLLGTPQDIPSRGDR